MKEKESQQELKRRALRSEHEAKETSGSSKRKSKQRDGTSAAKRDGSADRSFAEGVVSTLFHAIVVAYYLIVLFAEIEILKPRPEAIRVMGGTTFGGRWKFLTYINLRIQVSFFVLSLLADIFPHGGVKQWLRTLSDHVFIAMVFPLTMVVFWFFWGIYAIDRELVYPSFLDEYVPYILNHVWHTFILPIVIIEALLVFHHHCTNMAAITTFVMFSICYTGWVLIIYKMSGKWVYPFMQHFNPLGFVMFSAVCTMIGFMFFLVGKRVCKLNPYWRARHCEYERMKKYFNK